jgi:hypothetical protein
MEVVGADAQGSVALSGGEGIEMWRQTSRSAGLESADLEQGFYTFCIAASCSGRGLCVCHWLT